MLLISNQHPAPSAAMSSGELFGKEWHLRNQHLAPSAAMSSGELFGKEWHLRYNQ